MRSLKALTLVDLVLIAALWALAYAGLKTAAVVFTVFPAAWIFLAAGGVLALTRLAKRKPAVQLTAHGTARWADANDLAGAGMLGGRRGLILGRLWGSKPDSPLVRLPNAVHSVIFAPAGAGKSTGIAIPFLLDGANDESAVVIDLKGELALATAATRQRMGQNIVLCDPYRIVAERWGWESATFNPLDFISKDSGTALDDCDDLAKALVVRTGEERETHWPDSAEKWISAFTAAVVYYGTPGKRSLQEVASLLSHPQKLEMTIKLMLECPGWGGMLCRRGGELLNYAEKEKSSVLTTCSRFLGFLNTPAMAACTRTSTFKPAYLKRGLTTVYLVLPPERMKSGAGWMRSMVSSLTRAVVHEGLCERPRVHFVLDEAASLGQMDCLEDLVDKYRGYGCRAQFYYQSIGQLKKCWPKDQGQTLLSNTSKIYFGTNDFETARMVSDMLGKQTIIVDGGGQSASGGTNSGWSDGAQGTSHSGGNNRGWTGNSSWQQSPQELLKPEQVLALAPRMAITFPGLGGVPPVCTGMIRHYEKGWRGIEKAAASPRQALWKAAALLVVGLVLDVWVQALKLPITPRRVDPGVAITKRALEIVEQERLSGKASKPVKAAKRWEAPPPPLVISPGK